MSLFGRKTKRAAGGSAVETPPPRAVDPEIPQLKEKEEEKKGAGVPWYAGSSTGGSGLVGGAGIARVGASMGTRWGLLGSQRIAAALASAFRGTALGGLFAGKMGAPLVLSAMLGWGGMMALAGLKLAAGPVQTASGPVTLGGVGGSGVVIDSPKDRSLGYLAHANKGEIVWDKAHPMAPKDAPAEEEFPEETVEESAEAQEEVPAFEMPDVSELMNGKKGLDRDGFVKKLTSDPSQLSAGAGGARLKNGLAGFNLKKQIVTKPAFSKSGRLKTFARGKQAARGSRINTARGASKAMGQLKLAKHLSNKAVGASDSGARAFGADAFDQGQTIGGELEGVDGNGIVVPPGTGAPGLTSGVPDTGPGTNYTPYQSDVDQAKSMNDTASSMKGAGLALIAAGVALIAAGAAIGGIVGAILMAVGGMLVGAGVMLEMMAGKMAGKAADKGDKIEEEYGQNDQGDIVKECGDQATSESHLSHDKCTAQSPEQNQESHRNVRESVDETMNSEFTDEGQTFGGSDAERIRNGGPIGQEPGGG